MATSNSTTEYSFSFDDLMNEIMSINQLRVKEIYSKDNNKLLFDNYAITDDDSEILKRFVENAVYDLVEVSLPLMSNVTDSIKTDDSYGVVVKNLGHSSQAAKESVQNSFKQLIVASALMQWYEMKGLAEDMKLWNMKLGRLKTDVIKKRMIQLKIR